MLQLPSVSPSDTSLYPSGAGSFDVGAANSGSKILFYNESPLNIDLDFLNGSTDVLHAWEANWWLLDGDTKQIEWQIDPNSLNMVDPPLSVVFMTLYNPGEFMSGQYPVALVRQTNQGNPQAGGGGTVGSSLINTANAPATNVVTVDSTGATGSTWTVTNDGLWYIATTIAAALVQALKINETDPILQLGEAGHETEVLGTLKVDQLLTIAAGLAATGGVTTDTLTTTDAANVGNALTVTAGGITVDAGATHVKALTATGAATLSGGATVTGGTTTDTLTTTGAATIGDGLTVSAGGINVTGLTQVKALTATGAATLSGGETVTGGASIDTLELSGLLSLAQSGATIRAIATPPNDTLVLNNSTNAVLKILTGTNGVDLLTGSYNFPVGSLSRVSPFSGVGNGTFNHGLGVMPDYFLTLPCNVSSSSQTIGLANATTSQVIVTTGAGLGWNAVAYLN
jgi:hypothetical protein